MSVIKVPCSSIYEESGAYNAQFKNGLGIVTGSQSIENYDKYCSVNKLYELYGGMSENSSLNQLIFKYKIKADDNYDSYTLFDNENGTFGHIISDKISNSMIMEYG